MSEKKIKWLKPKTENCNKQTWDTLKNKKKHVQYYRRDLNEKLRSMIKTNQNYGTFVSE